MIIAQISDPHISVTEDQNAAQLRRAITHLLRFPAPPDVVLITGDCVDGGSPTQYERFRDLIRPLTMPVYVVPGNHDHRENLHAAFGDQSSVSMAGFVQYVVDDWPVRLIALDTHVPGFGEGHLSDQQLHWLEERLAEAPQRPTLLFMHHPPFKTGLAVFDQLMLTNADALTSIVQRHPQVERVLAGHIHSATMQRFAGTLAVTCASTISQMFPDFKHPERLAIVMEPPSCQLHRWHSSSGLVTHTSIIGEHGPFKEIHDGTQWL